METPAAQRPTFRYLRWDWATAAAIAILIYMGFGLALMNCTGVQADEVIFVPLLAHPKDALYSRTILHHRVALMSMSYLGLVKWWLYKPIFALAGMNVTSLRLPMLLFSAGTLSLLAGLLHRLSGVRAAFFTVMLLATDRTFVLTTTYDWGPVVLQMFFQAVSLTCFVRWYDTHKRIWLFGAGLAVGLGFWDKAIFVWFFSALCLAALIFAGRTLRKLFTKERMVCFVLGFAIGAFPLILYNIHTPNATLRQNGAFFPSAFPAKANYLVHAVNGETIEAFFTDLSRPSDHEVSNFHTKLDDLARVRSNGRFYLLIVLVPLSLFFCRGAVRTWILVLFVAGWIAWFEAALPKLGAGSVHHLVLFYPLWFASLGLAAGALAERFGRLGRWGYGLSLFGASALGALQLNSNLADFPRYSNHSQWTDALPRFADLVRAHPGTQVFVLDWGIGAPLQLTYGLDVRVKDISFLVSEGRSLRNEGLQDCAQSPCIAVAFALGREVLPGVEEKFIDGLKGSGVAARRSDSIIDPKGVPAYDIFNIVPVPISTEQE